ncbi:MAG: DegT/DnrJ/EryC1/StrS family aminotransferase [Sediminibacterium sp.]|uniref:DegT/DnrJ/EryC1/StrS family aminotransferase n=1 Tax=Sediminibacterium sp. TaxID=1917865 RepID=UPI002AB9DF84|nr:DegT/DnrJ/EryC1/StrS family aminotransferase [Sediminibacterium sp.]MDZ4070727.1 DegT/DnrJ/EryC1/StrS family aminotransferase [Sediminibacterium sp.]
MKNKKIWLSSPHMGGSEEKFVKDAFDSNWVAPLGPNVNGFESDIESYLGIKYAAALSSGTAAIHLALVLLEVGYGDEVLCQSFTFSASANPIVYQGATPIFIDSEESTWNMNPFYLRKAIQERMAIGKKPKAIILVHLYGMPANLTEILAIAEEYEIPLIEDAAEALGSSFNGKKCGTFGRFGILSFNGNKIITTSGGGALVANDKEAIEKARFLATQARDPTPHYQHSSIGYNYRMSNISAGIGRGQMEVIDERIAQRRAINAKYKTLLSEVTGVTFQQEKDERVFSNYWLTSVLIDPKLTGGFDREMLRLEFDKENIESRPLWKPMHLQPIFRDTLFFGDGTSERLFTNGLCLPSGSNLTMQELDRVFEVLKKSFQIN